MHTHFNFELGAQELASLAKWLQTDAAAERQKQQVESGSKFFSLWNNDDDKYTTKMVF
jgi:hypothetical protein